MTSPPAVGTADGAVAPPFLVLAICTGNICRSPVAELMLRAGLAGHTGVEVSSAGLAARVGEPVAEPMARLLRARGINQGGFLSRQLEVDELRAANMVITMTAAQRAAVVSRVPAAVRRTFTLSEFAGLAAEFGVGPVDGGPADRLAALVRAVPRARQELGGRAAHRDIEDPYRRPDEVFARVFHEIDAAVGSLLERAAPRDARGALRGEPAVPAPVEAAGACR